MTLIGRRLTCLIYPIPKDPVAASVGFLRGKGPRWLSPWKSAGGEKERDEA